MMAWWWWPQLPSWLGSGALWFVVLNAVVAAVAALSRARSPLVSPRRRAGVTRRASSAVLQSLRSFSIFSFPSACFNTTPFAQPQPHGAAQEPDAAPPAAPAKPSPSPSPSPRALPPSPSPAPQRVPVAGEGDDEDGEEPEGMSMDEAYALALAARRRPEREREEEARQSEVDAKAEEFIRGFQDDQRQQRLNSIFNYTQMLKHRALGAAGRRQPAEARPEQP